MAVFVGFISVAVLSLGTDQVLHVLEIYPQWGKPMHDPSLNVLALSYRIVYTILGGYITASWRLMHQCVTSSRWELSASSQVRQARSPQSPSPI
jgi:hypothetical protein